MFMFVDGQPVVLSFALVEGLYYKAFTQRFPEANVSLTQWRGSYEYQAIYPDIQMLVETGVITRDAMNHIGQSIVQLNEEIKRPACLYSRVVDRFAEAGFEASIRIADESNKGEVAICVENLDNQDEIDAVAIMIRDEVLPVGQVMIGDIEYETALSNGQSITIRWVAPTDVPTGFRYTITRRRGSPYPAETVDEIIAKFNLNYAEQMGIGSDITPQTYLSLADLPWASSVTGAWYDGASWIEGDQDAAYDTRYVGELLPANVVIV